MAIFTLVEHKIVDGMIYGYAPYISEMNIWINHFQKVIVVGNFTRSKKLNKIDLNYDHSNIELITLPKFNIKSPLQALKFALNLPLILFKITRAMIRSDYFHFRCPSNVSAIAAIAQVFFPGKPKSTKYAGNWDPKSDQPLGYRFQKWLLTSTLLTKRMQVLVYGEWPNQSPYVYPFFSATYFDNEKVNFVKRDFTSTLKFVFIGAMVVGKRPILSIKIIKELMERGYKTELHMFGDGDLMEAVNQIVDDQNLTSSVFLYGNQDRVKVKNCLLDAHFTILPSKSEGWPKAIAEGMFFGAIPISTRISCLPWILDEGKQGILIDPDLKSAVDKIDDELKKGSDYLNHIAQNALKWSQQYTVNRLELEISKVIHDA